MEKEKTRENKMRKTWRSVADVAGALRNFVGNSARLFFSFGQKNNKNENNQKNTAENIKLNHNIVNVNRAHNNYFPTNNKLIDQAKAESINQDIMYSQSTSCEKIGPTKAEAKNICATSEKMSEILATRDFDNLGKSNLIQDNNTAGGNNLSNQKHNSPLITC